jgi:hypothetical protein
VNAINSDALKFHRSQSLAVVPSAGTILDKPLISERLSVFFHYTLVPLMAPLDAGAALFETLTKTVNNINNELDGVDLNHGETEALDKLVRSKMNIAATARGLREAMGGAQTEALHKDIFENQAINKKQIEVYQNSDCLYRRLFSDPKNQTRISGFMFQQKPSPGSKTSIVVPGSVPQNSIVSAPALKQWFVMAPDLSTNKAGYAYKRDFSQLFEQQIS